MRPMALFNPDWPGSGTRSTIEAPIQRHLADPAGFRVRPDGRSSTLEHAPRSKKS